MWRLAPFYIALAVAPLLFGGVKPESQAALGILLSLALIFTHAERDSKIPVVPRWLKIALTFVLILPLIPFPISVVKILSPERARLALQFPLDGIVPDWLTLSTSPARSIQRLWELTLAAAAFVLARHAATRPGGARAMAIALATGLALLGASDIWARTHTRETVLGLWKISWGKGFGTFANHNHFANWIFVASLYCGGWLVRERKSSLASKIGVATSVLFAIVLAFMSASRGGTVAFIIGLIAILFLFRDRLQRHRTRLAASFVIIATIAIALLSGDKLIARFRNDHTGETLDFKTAIWSQTASIISKFPIFGTGPGSFVRVYNIYKTGSGDSDFLHAENDYVEAPLEYGIPGALLLFIALFLVARKAFEQSNTPLIAGIAGAVTVYAIHCCGEFISYVPANLILIAALIGFALGRATAAKTDSQLKFSQMIASVVFLALSLLQLFSWQQFWSGNVGRSVALWPFIPNREIALIRLESNNKPKSEPAHLHRAIVLDPLNWELRLEQTWFQLAFTTNRSRALSNAWLTVRLNPLQGQIPLRFAQHFAQRDPDTALSFLAAVDPAIPRNHETALDLAWQITRNPAQLWSLTPDTVPALQNLIHFAQAKGLHSIAAQAALVLEGRVEPLTLAQHLLDVQRPADALRLIGENQTARALKLKLFALHQLKRDSEAVTVAASLFAQYPTLQNGYSTEGSHQQLLTRHQANPNDPATALLLAEKTASMKPLDLPLLTTLAAKFPSEPRIQFLVFKVQLELTQTNAAAQTAADIANRLPAN